MAAPINIPVNVQLQNVSQLQRQIQQATQNIRINLVNGNSARSLTALSQPLGRLTGQADEFTKSMDAANARVLAFGASVGVVNAFTNAFKSLIASTIEVEKAIKAITVVGDQFAGSTKELGQGLFNVAKLTGQSFTEVSKAALEFSRQGLKLEDTLQRTQDALILTRLTGLDSAKAVDGLTAAFNAFSKAGLSTSQILNKLAAVDQAFAVSSADLIEGFNRSAAVAQNAGVTFDELAGIITALQQETSRGGAVIGNALKTIFTRLQDSSTLKQLDNLGIAVQDLQGNILPARQILQNLAKDVEGLGQITKAGIFKDVAGTFQINQLISLVGDLNKQNSIAADATKKSAGATNEAYTANEKLNQSLDAILNKVAISGKQIGSILGNLGISDNLKGLLDGLNSFLEYASETLQGDSIGAKFAQGIVKGIGSVLTGPGVAVFLAIITKLSYDLIKFGAQGLKTFFNIGQAAKQQQQIQESIVQTLLRNQNVLSQIVNTQGGQNAQAQAFLNILRQEEQTLQNIRTLAGGIAAPVIAAGYRTGDQGLRRRSAGGYLPAQEAADVRRGVGGASPSSKVVTIPNFAFGGGKRGTMIANTSEYIVPNYAGGGSAIFNQDMAKTMGLPPGAKKISAAGGFIPNFADNGKTILDKTGVFAMIVNDQDGIQEYTASPEKDKSIVYKFNSYGIPSVTQLKNKKGGTFAGSRFTNESLIQRYTKAAEKEAEAYSLAIAGRKLQPFEKAKLSNPGVVKGLVGAIFESGIGGVINGKGLEQAQLDQKSNALIDFERQPQINKFFGIDPEIKYVEAKYRASSDALKSMANKIYNVENKGTFNVAKISDEQIQIWKQQAKEVDLGGRKNTTLTPKRNAFLRELMDAGAINSLNSTQAKKFLGLASSGYIPNFASTALQAAISRERSAGVPASQIYVDQSPALQSSANPIGLMVANRRDEPAGGFQGISRARNEGRNPKTYGAANGFIPNFAPAPTSSTSSSQAAEKGLGDLAGKFIVLQGALTFLQGGFTEVGSTAAKLNEGLQTLTAAFFAFSAIQQSQAKSSSELFKKLKSQSRKDLYRSGVSDRAVGRATGGISGRIQYAVGTAKRDVAVSTLGSLAGAAAASVVALKSFNDIASLFYTRGDKLDSSLELLSSSASKASSSLSDVDKAALKSVNAGLNNIGIGATVAKWFSSLNPGNLGRDTVAYNSLGQTTISNLKGGQTAQDFGKIQEDLNSLIFSSLRASLPKASDVSIADKTKNQIGVLFADATVDGILDLEKVINSDYVQGLKKSSDETARKIEIATSNISFNKPVEQFKRSIEKIISTGSLIIENSTKELERQSQLISAITSSKAFSSLSESSKIAFEINSSSTQLKRDIENRISKFANDAQSSLLEFIPDLGLDLGTRESLKRSVEGLGSSTTQQDFEKNLNSFNKALESSNQIADKSKLAALDKKLAEITNSFENLQKQIENEQDILAFNNSEKLLEARAYDTYKNKLASFVDSMVEGEKKLIQLRGEIERIDIQKQGNIDILSAQAKTSRDAILIRREEELKAFNVKNPKEKEAMLAEKTLSIKREFFTKENIAGLNRNTDALNALTTLLAADFIAKIDSAISALKNGSNELDNTLMSNVDKIQLPEQMNRPQALKYLTDLRGVYAPSATLPMKSGGNLKTAEGFIDQIKGFIEAGNTFGDIQSSIEKFQAPQDMRDRLIEVSKDLYESYQKEGAVSSETLETLKKRFDVELETYDILNSYSSKLQAQTRALRDSLSDPQTVGEYILKQREIARNEKEQGKASPAKQRAYRSSFGYGLSQGFDEVEKRTLDFKNELGREIPQLFSSNLAQGLNDAISGAKSLKDALSDAATSFLNALTQKNIENLANMFTNGIGGAVRSTGFFASGGMISGGSGTKDDVPAMLMGGEYVIKKSAVKKYGSRFLDSLNNGGVQAFAAGGAVQSGKGGFYVPGDFGTGAITGKNQLLEFAGQSFTGGQYDRMGGFGMSGASISLEPESARLTAYGRENSPIFERVQQAKEEAFNVYLDQLKQESAYQEQLKQMEEAEKARKKQLKRAIISAVASTALSYIGSSLSAGGSNALGAATQEAAANNQTLSLGSKFTTYLGGAFGKGGATGTGGLGNVLSGNFGKATVNFGAIGKNYGAKPNYIFSGGSLRGVNYGSVSLPGSSMGGRSSNSGFSFGSLFGLGKRDYSSGVFEYGDYSYNPSMGAYGRRKRASGGFISGGSGIRDDIPTMLTGGEFVLNNRATRKLGVQNLNRLNAGATESQQSSGGVSDALISKLDELIQTTRESSKDNVVVNVSGMETGGEKRSDENKSSNDRELQRKIKEAVLAVIAQEKRLGGSLNK